MATFKGSPPGYVGYGEGAVLTEAVRRRPYSVVLLDKAEKAHGDVMELFYQVFDKGDLEDAAGVVVDFKNTIILLATNAAGDAIRQVCRGRRPDPDELVEIVRPELLKHFPAALVRRLAVVPYYPLGEEEIRAIVELKLEKVRGRIRENHAAELTWDDEVVEEIAGRCTAEESGARNIDYVLTQMLLPELSGELLGRMASGESFESVELGVGSHGRFAYAMIQRAAPST